MAKRARVVDGVAVDVITVSPNGRYHPTIAAQFQTVPAFVSEGFRLVNGEWQAPPDAPAEPETPAAPRSLTHIEFVRHAREAGGLTPEAYLQAQGDQNLAFFWAMFNLATAVERDDPDVRAGADAFEQLGYLSTAGKTAIFDNWPTV